MLPTLCNSDSQNAQPSLLAIVDRMLLLLPFTYISLEERLVKTGIKVSNPPQVLAKKMTVLYHVAQQQLSKQSHYDWGLRALTAVLRMAGKLRRDSPGLSEIMVLMRALR